MTDMEKKKRNRLYHSAQSTDGELESATPSVNNSNDSGQQFSSNSDNSSTDQTIDSLNPEALDKSLSILKSYTAYTSGAGIIPFPGADIATVSVLQYRLVSKIAEQYGIEVEKERLKQIIGTLLATVVTASIAYGPVSQFLALTSGLGWVMKSAVSISISGATTYALGNLFIRHFESGGTLLDFDVKEQSKAYKKMVDETLKSENKK